MLPMQLCRPYRSWSWTKEGRSEECSRQLIEVRAKTRTTSPSSTSCSLDDDIIAPATPSTIVGSWWGRGCSGRRL